MNRGTRLLGYLLVLGALAVLLIAIPSAWATPEQSQVVQMTVPTRTPKPPPPQPPGPTDVPPPDQQPSPVPRATAGTLTPVASVTPPPTPALAARLVLKKEVVPVSAWPGATLHYTLTLSNQGTASAQQIEVLDTLPADLLPGPVSGGADARWDGQVLRVRAAILPPASQLTIAYTADVRANASPGGVVSNQASVTASGDLHATAGASIALPPAELPPTGGSLDGAPDTPVSRR
jgi:uncharacterized repeat protein (TIGR01451 family)